MEPTIEKAFEIADYMSNLVGQKRILQEDFEQTLYVYINGGTFKATRELISFISNLDTESYIIVDENKIPIFIEELSLFLDKLKAKHTEAVNLYFTRYESLLKNKNFENLLT